MTVVTVVAGSSLRRALDDAQARGFRRRVVTIPAGARRDYDADEWADALVVVSRGSVRVEARCGSGVTLLTGDVLWLADLPLLGVSNAGDDDAVLVAISRPDATTGPVPLT